MSEAKFKVGEYVQLVNLSAGNSPRYEGTWAKVLTNRPASNPDNGYFYDVELHDGQTKGLFERRLQQLPVGTTVQVTATISCTGRSIPPSTVGTIEGTSASLYGVRSTDGAYYGVSLTEVQPILTIQTTSTTQEETVMEAKLSFGTKVRSTHDVKLNSGRVGWLKGAVGTVRQVGEHGELVSVQCTDDWFAVPKDQRQYWEVVSEDTELTVCKPDSVVPETATDEPYVGKRVKIRKSSDHYADQGRNINGKRRKGTVEADNSGLYRLVVSFTDGYRNSYRVDDLKFLKDKSKAPEFVPEPVTTSTPVGTKVRVTDEHPHVNVGAVGILERQDGDTNPKIRFSNDYWFVNYTRLETAHPDTAITKDNGDATL